MLHRWLTRKLGSSGNVALGEKASEAVARRLAELEKGSATGDDSSLRKDVLSKLMSAKNPDGTPFSVAQVKVQANSILGAGSDTTSITFRALLAYILKDKRIYTKVMEELDEAVESGAISFPITYAAASKLEYFQVRFFGRTRRPLIRNLTLPFPRSVGLPERDAPPASRSAMGVAARDPTRRRSRRRPSLCRRCRNRHESLRLSAPERGVRGRREGVSSGEVDRSDDDDDDERRGKEDARQELAHFRAGEPDLRRQGPSSPYLPSQKNAS